MRLLAASLLGLPLGLERESRDKPAGMRTLMLVSIASAVFTLIALSMTALADDAPSAVRLDPVRAIEAVVAGVAFLGAGTIIRSGGDVHGITTGASIWLVGGIGTACGVGLFALAAGAAALGLVVLFVLGHIEAHAKDEEPD